MTQELVQKRWITPKAAAQVLGCATNDLLSLTRLGMIKRKETHGGHGRYDTNDLMAIINFRQSRISTTSLPEE